MKTIDMKRFMKISFGLVVPLLFAARLMATDYYFDGVGGDDSHDGKSPKTAWKTLKQANETKFRAGDQLLFKAGTKFVGPLQPRGNGTEAAPIRIDRYGEGDRPLIEGGGIEAAVLLKNVRFWEIRGLEVTNHGKERAPWRYGVHLLADDDGLIRHLYVSDLYVHDVNGSLAKEREGCGIFFESRNARFYDLRIENCHVVRTDRNGICQLTAGFAKRSEKVVIRNNLLEDIGGDGIKLWGTDGGLIEYNVVRGARRRCLDAAAGIWPFGSDNTVMQFNEVSGTRGTHDGQGFDIDYQTRNTVMQYNYSHDNDGGFLLICTTGESYCEKPIVRYNISVNDGIVLDSKPKDDPEADAYGATFRLSGRSTDGKIYNNLIFMTKKQRIPLIRSTDWGGGRPQNLIFANNIFYVEGQARYEFVEPKAIKFSHNVFFGTHEKRPDDEHAILADPLLKKPGEAPNGFKTLADAFGLKAGSPCIGAGMKFFEKGKDFAGVALPDDRAPSIGAFEYVPAK